MLYFVSYEACFHLSGHSSFQNTKYWNVENPYLLQEKLVHDEKTGYGVLFLVIVSLHQHFLTLLLIQSYTLGFSKNYMPSWFMVSKELLPTIDKATFHMSRDSLARIHESFTKEENVSKCLWPARSPELSTCGFFCEASWRIKFITQIPTLKTN